MRRLWPWFLLGGVAVAALLIAANKEAREAVTEIVDQFSESLKGLIARFEGLRLDAYQDAAGKWTIGYGHLIRPGEPYHPYGPVTRITQEEADALFEQDSAIALRAVDLNVKVPLTDNQRAALVSFVFNVGATAFAQSTLLKKLNASDYTGAAAELDRWVTAGGVRLAGLVARRAMEKEVFLA